MKSSFSGNVLLEGIWEAELLKLKTHVPVKLNFQLGMITVVTVFRQQTHCRQDVAHSKQDDETIAPNEAAHFSQVNYHAASQGSPHSQGLQLWGGFVLCAAARKEGLGGDRNKTATNHGWRQEERFCRGQ